jgi:hypothetical protein
MSDENRVFVPTDPPVTLRAVPTFVPLDSPTRSPRPTDPPASTLSVVFEPIEALLPITVGGALIVPVGKVCAAAPLANSGASRRPSRRSVA